MFDSHWLGTAAGSYFRLLLQRHGFSRGTTIVHVVSQPSSTVGFVVVFVHFVVRILWWLHGSTTTKELARVQSSRPRGQQIASIDPGWIVAVVPAAFPMHGR